MIDALRAERIKLTTTRAPLWCSILVVVFGLGVALAIAATAVPSLSSTDERDRLYPTPELVLMGVSEFGVVIAFVLAALTVTTEYRFGLIRTTFLAIPARGRVLAAKGLLIGAAMAVLLAVVSVLAIVLTRVIVGADGARELVLTDPGAWRPVYGTALFVFVGSFLAVAVGALLRHTAGTVTLLILWMLALENLVQLIPTVGPKLVPFMPFLNVRYFLGGVADPTFHWGPWGGIVYFTVVTAAVFAVAVVVVRRRDA